MARGFIRGTYNTDGGVGFGVRVEADRFADAAFGWTSPAAGTVHTGYPTAQPRHVIGVEASSGKSAKAIVPDLTADVWTGTGPTTSFTAKDDDGVSHTYIITSRVGEVLHLMR